MQLILFLLVTYIIFIRIVKIKLKKHFLCLPLIFGELYITRDKRNFIILLKKLRKCKVCLRGYRQDRGYGQNNWPLLVHNPVVSYKIK